MILAATRLGKAWRLNLQPGIATTVANRSASPLSVSTVKAAGHGKATEVRQCENDSGGSADFDTEKVHWSTQSPVRNK